MVADVIHETPDTSTLVFLTGTENLNYRAGQFCTIDPHQFDALARFTAYLEDKKEKREPPRAYSMCSAPHQKYLAVTVKEESYQRGITEYPPLLSPLLVNQTPRGTKMVLTGFTGPYALPDDIESKTDHLVHLVAGSGAVPNFSILQDCLERRLSLRHTFICSNKTIEDICFRAALDRLEEAHPQKLKVVHTLTRHPDAIALGAKMRQGRLSLELLREFIPDPTGCVVYACGPAIGRWERKAAARDNLAPQPRFMEHVLEQLKILGVPSDRIKRESYG